MADIVWCEACKKEVVGKNVFPKFCVGVGLHLCYKCNKSMVRDTYPWQIGMIWCELCKRKLVAPNPIFGHLLCCPSCGSKLEDFTYDEALVIMWCKTCEKIAQPKKVDGLLVCNCTTEVTVVRDEFTKLSDHLLDFVQTKSDAVVDVALQIFRTAVDKKFTRGRKFELVLASCLYFACREKDFVVLFIRFSSHLRVSVHELVSVYVELCKLYSLVKDKSYEKLVDPTFFIPGFTNGLLKSGHDDETIRKVIGTAMNIIVCTRIGDWSQTSKKPSGICGAAICIAALSHDIADISEATITNLSHDIADISEETITKRLNEFANTEAASLTVEELKIIEPLRSKSTSTDDESVEVVNCKHKESKICAYGLCKDCYEKFLEVYAALQQAEKERMENEASDDLDGDFVDDEQDIEKEASDDDLDGYNFPGQSQTFESFVSSRERKCRPARDELVKMGDALQIGDDAVVNMAFRFFVMTDGLKFTREVKSEIVLATCLYLACWRKNLPVLLNDFSSYLRVTVHELASDCSLLCGEAFRKDTSEEHLDPSVFISDYINGLLKSGHDDETTTKVFETAMNIMASMKGDWVKTGRKHSVVCRAAIYIAALSHDIGEEKITKMMNEIANTEVESITVEELKKIDSILLKKLFTPRPNSDKEVVNCKHKDSRSVGYGLCKNCHVKFTQVYADVCLSEESEASDDLDDGPVTKRQKRAEVAKNAPPA